MLRPIHWTTTFALLASACASTPGARPHDMSAARHEQEAAAHTQTGEQHAARYDQDATVTERHCRPRKGDTGPPGAVVTGTRICWTSVTNPTEAHLEQAQEHRRQAADHRAASRALRDAEAQACAGIADEDRDISPFEHTEDIASVTPLMITDDRNETPNEQMKGAVVTFRAVPGLTAEWLQRVIDCHLGRNASLGHVVPEMPNCPLVPNGARARVSSTGSGFAVEIRSDTPAVAREILDRAQRLRSAPDASPSKPR